MKILSLGAGVNSVALLVLKAQSKVEFDVAVFADTGGENPETYLYIEQVIKPFCERHKIPLEIIKRQGKDLYEECWDRKIIPTRMFRSCTDKFKIRVLKDYVRKNFPQENITFLIGISTEENQRAKNGCGNEYPLMDLDINREGCKKIISDAGLPIPIKSGCYFCPFTPKHGLLNLLKKHPELYAKAEELEKNGRQYPRMTLAQASLETLRKSIQDQKSMCSFLNTCAMCEVEDNEW